MGLFLGEERLHPVEYLAVVKVKDEQLMGCDTGII